LARYTQGSEQNRRQRALERRAPTEAIERERYSSVTFSPVDFGITATVHSFTRFAVRLDGLPRRAARGVGFPFSLSGGWRAKTDDNENSRR
jgi:hypothetical protein